MTPKTFAWTLALLLVVASTALALAQDDPRELERYKNGFLPTGTYGASSVSMNLHNGNLIAVIPLVSLPGRAGHDLNITASYNSIQLIKVPNLVGTYDLERFHKGPLSGGWVINVWPSLQQVGTSAYYFTTPDGSLHKLTGWSRYYSHDSTNIVYDASLRRVLFPDLRYWDFSEYDSLKKVHDVDRNGNRITYQFETAYPYRPVSITDTLGRVVSLTYHGTTKRLQTLTVNNHAGSPLTYTFGYQFYPVPYVPSYYGYATYRYWDPGDTNMLSSLTLPNGTQFSLTYETAETYWYGYVTVSSLQLSQLVQPAGSSINVGYAYVPIPDANLARHVGSITVDPYETTPFTTQHSYTVSGGVVTSTTETRPDGSKRVASWDSSGLRSSETFKDTDGTTTLQTVSTSWLSTTYGKHVGETSITYYKSGQQTLFQATDTNEYDFLGNVTTSTRASGNWKTRTVRYYDYLSSGFSRPRRVETKRWEGGLWLTTDTAEYLYDQFGLTDRGTVLQQAPGHGPTNTSRSNLTTVRRYLASEDRWVNVVRNYYDTVGNHYGTQDVLDRVVEWKDYSPAFHFAYPTLVANALSQAITTNYSIWSGLPVSTTDANGQTTSFQYDALNRVSRVDAPNGAWETNTYNDTYFTGAYRTLVTTAKSIDATHSTSETTYYDGLGRPLRTERSEGGGVVSRVDREYALCSCSGKTARVSMPYRPGETVYWTESQYDGLGRIRKVIPPDGSASANFTEYRYAPVYNGVSAWYLMTGVYNAKGIGKVHAYDALGQLREVREDAGADFSSSVITYYEPRQDGTVFSKPDPNQPGYYLYYMPWTENRITQGVQVRSTKSDSLGRLRFETHPENGTVTYTYDDAGRLLTKTDARGIVTTTGYDALDRPLAVSFSDSTPDITYTYDQGSFGIGRLRSVTNGIATSTYAYNNVGQVTREDKTINGLAFYTTTTYNLAGQALATRLPNGTIITNSYDAVGRLSSLASSWVDANHPATLASGFVYNAAGAVISMDYGNSLRMTRTFNSGMQLKTLRHGTVGSPGSILNYEYGYQESVSNTGQIMGIIDYNDRTKDVSYTYDRFHRLQTAETVGLHWGLTWTYDRYGNRSAQTVAKGTAPANSLAVNAATNRVSAWTYDAAGNTLGDGRHTYTYNALNQQTTMDGTTEYRYDASGNRVMKISGGTTTYYVLGAGEYVSGAWQRLYVSVNGSKLLEYTSGTTYFFHTDHLGTARAQTSLAGAVVGSWSNYPYGEQWQQSGVTNKDRYTGKERDSETANDYFGARYYWNGAARWLSVDPAKGGRNPQRLNRYSYVSNDPINFSDPDGRWMFSYYCVWFLKYSEGMLSDAYSVCDSFIPEGPLVPETEPVGAGLSPFETDFNNCFEEIYGADAKGDDVMGIEAFTVAKAISNAVGLDPVVLATTWSIESGFSFAPRNGQNTNGTVDIGPLQLNYATWTSRPGLFEGDPFGTNIRGGEVFNGSAYDNIMFAAQYLTRLVRRFGDLAPGYYRAGEPMSEKRNETPERRQRRLANETRKREIANERMDQFNARKPKIGGMFECMSQKGH